jgi:hypothetical protein
MGWYAPENAETSKAFLGGAPDPFVQAIHLFAKSLFNCLGQLQPLAAQ